MVTLLAKIFIKDSEDKIKQREAYGMLCGVIGILFNVLLFIGKFLAGTLSNSIAITADAFNNLSDAGSSIVTLLGFKLAGAKPDTEHPFGHGRIEYVSGLVVAAAILLMGYELVRDSIGKIMHPEETEFTLLVAVILIASILVKLYMAYYNRAIGKKLDSAAMKAVATDSLSDTAATTVVLLASVFTHFTGIKIDGYCGLVVGLLVGYPVLRCHEHPLERCGRSDRCAPDLCTCRCHSFHGHNPHPVSDYPLPDLYLSAGVPGCQPSP